MASLGRRSGARRRGGHLGDLTAAYVDGQLGDLEMAGARDHVDACTDCAAAVAAQRLLKQRVRGLAGAPATPPASLLDRLATLGDQMSSPAPVRGHSARRRLPALSIAAGLLVMAAAGGLALSGRNGEAPGVAPTAPTQATPASQSVPAPSPVRPREISIWTVMTTGTGWSGRPGAGR